MSQQYEFDFPGDNDWAQQQSQQLIDEPQIQQKFIDNTQSTKNKKDIINKPKEEAPLTQTAKNPVPKQFQKKNQSAQIQKQEPPKVTKVISKNKDKDNKRIWLKEYKVSRILGISSLTKQQSSSKRYKIQFAYLNKQHKECRASVRFGRRDVNYYVHNSTQQSQSDALLKQAQIRKASDPFQANYWALWILNNPNCATIPKAIAYFNEKNQIYTNL